MIYIFNPEHEMALANFDANYMPPAAVRQFANDMAVFPIWWAGRAEDMVVAPSAYNLSFLRGNHQQFSTLPGVITPTELPLHTHTCIKPWGWNPALCAWLRQMEWPLSKLPDASSLLYLRDAAHRRHAVELLRLLQFEQCGGMSAYLTDLKDLKAFVESQEMSLLKAPISGSGKGLNWCKGIFTPHIRDWCLNLISKQGGVVAEPVYDKVEDFAMQFHSDGEGGMAFCGYSLFNTTKSGAYLGNRLMRDPDIEKHLASYVSLSTIRAVQHALIQHLGKRLKNVYEGQLGVDMMIYRRSFNAQDFMLHPCVEINLRMNMGMASRLICDRYVDPGSEGLFRVDCYPSNLLLRDAHQRRLVEKPLAVECGRVVEGYMPLVPVTPFSQYSAWIEVERTSLH